MRPNDRANVAQLKNTVQAQGVALQAHSLALQTLNSHIQLLSDQVAAIPALIAAAKAEAISSTITQLLGGVGAAYDTLKELADMGIDNSNVAKALTLRIGALEYLTGNLDKTVNEPGTGLVAVVSTTKATAATASTNATQAATQAAAATTLGNNALAEAGKRLLRTGDTATGQIVVPMPSSASAAVQLQQLMLGVGRPYRTLRGVGATAVKDGDPVQDPSGSGKTWLVGSIRGKFETAPGVGGILTVKTTAGFVIYTKTFIAGALPVANDFVEFAGLVGTTLPVEVDITGGVLVQADLTSGKLKYLTIDGVLAKPA